MENCSIHKSTPIVNEQCWMCEEGKINLIKANLANMTMNKHLGTITQHDKTNSRIVEKTDSVVDSIIDQFINRAQFGKVKYNTNLDREDLSVVEWIEHAQQELMDGILYLEKLKTIFSGKK
jgi:hypothetical protein